MSKPKSISKSKSKSAPKDKLIDRQRVLDWISIHIKDAQSEKRHCQRFSPGWNRADAVQPAMSELLADIKRRSYTTTD